jgi:hypothetical protein
MRRQPAGPAAHAQPHPFPPRQPDSSASFVKERAPKSETGVIQVAQPFEQVAQMVEQLDGLFSAYFIQGFDPTRYFKPDRGSHRMLLI